MDQTVGDRDIVAVLRHLNEAHEIAVFRGDRLLAHLIGMAILDAEETARAKGRADRMRRAN